MQIDTAKIAARVRKMLALARDAAATDEERDTAMRHVHSTLAKYNLEIAECESTGDTVQGEARGIERTDADRNSSVWSRTIANACAQLFFCSFFTSSGGKRYCYVGRPSNILTAREMTDYLVESIGREAVKLARRQGWDRRDGNDFRKAAAHAVYFRVQRMIKEAKAAAPVELSSGRALALVSVYESEHKANQLVIKAQLNLRSGGSRSYSYRSGEAAAAGQAYGNSVSLNRQVSGGGSRKMIRG